MREFQHQQPEILTRLRCHPGGHWRARLFDPRVRALWAHIQRAAAPGTFLATVNATQVGALLGVHRATVSRWLGWMHRHHLITITDRRGGQGRGVLLDVTWARRGAILESACQSIQFALLSHNELKAIPEEIKQTTRRERHRLVGAVRKQTHVKIQNPMLADALTRVVGCWAFAKHAPLGDLETVVKAVTEAPRIPVPRWVRTARDAWRWAWTLVRRLTRYGAGWWRLLQLQRDRYRLQRVERRLTAAHQAGQACPMCGRIHDRLDFEDGRDADGRLNCFGWVRVKLDDVAQDLAAERGARLINHTRCCRCGGDLDPDARGHVCGRCTYQAQLQADALAI